MATPARGHRDMHTARFHRIDCDQMAHGRHEQHLAPWLEGRVANLRL